MNLFIHGLDGKIELGNSYFNDLLASLQPVFQIYIFAFLFSEGWRWFSASGSRRAA
jgi:hypothetical protein